MEIFVEVKFNVIGLFLILFLNICCKEKPETLSTEKKTTEVFTPKYGKTFFDFDKIDFYSIHISDEEMMELDSLRSFSKQNELKYDLLSKDFPNKISEVNFTNRLTDLGFRKREINQKDFDEINKIFVEKTYQNRADYACIPMYRDILIFKKKSKITGFAKICFDCHQYHIIGSNGDTKDFGSDNDYENLGKILDRY